MNKSAILNNKGKFVVLALYVLVVFIAPLYYLTPKSQDSLVYFVKALVTSEDDAFFKQYIGLLQTGDNEKAYSLLSPEAKQVATPEQMQTVSAYFASTTNKMEVVAGGMNSRTTADGTTRNFDVYYEIENNDPVKKYVVAEITAQDIGNGLAVLGVHTIGAEKSIKEQPRFDFASQGIYLILSLLLPAIVVFTAYRYLTTAVKPTWPIFLVILFVTLYLSYGGGNFKVNFGFNGFMVPTGPWAPFAFLTPLPLGAIYYWIRRKKYETVSENKA